MPQIILLMLLLSSCSMTSKMALEFRDVQFFEIHETKSVPDMSLKISGLAFHSSLAVEKTEVIKEGDTATVFVYLTPTKKGLSGNFALEFPVPSNIDKVMFGPDKHLIWKRGVGPIKE
ncbi:hypothetical protein [Geobacter grbiciae]|uniref:hypothetical protein n=1 Tax=Geobacter grbiciae TaxID=155042 RepID=UPI001C015CA9|nr:hypothetical protein [Geobacter grbiciae]MBT1077315.1 hypothetical protein [Geobacter grbiciae]